MENVVVSGIAYEKNEAKISINGVPDKPGVAAKIFGALDAQNIVVDLIVQTARLPSGRRLVTHVSQVGFDENTQNYRIIDLFRIPDAPPPEGQEPQVVWTRTRPELLAQLQFEGILPEMNLTRPMLEV